MIISLATLTVFAGVAAAGTVQIGGTHSQSELSALQHDKVRPEDVDTEGGGYACISRPLRQAGDLRDATVLPHVITGKNDVGLIRPC
jgi:hypothetical protein